MPYRGRGSHPSAGLSTVQTARGWAGHADRLGFLMEIAAFQDVLRRTYIERDTERGVDGTFRWLTEEVGEVARALRGDGDLEHELGDVLAWLGSLANLAGVDLEHAAARFAEGCQKCGTIPCGCAFVR